MRLTSRTFTAYCQNPLCHHSRRAHPITGHVDIYGGFEDPGSATSECPACDSAIDSVPLFERDEPYVSEEPA